MVSRLNPHEFNPQWHHPYAAVAVVPARLTRDMTLASLQQTTFTGVGTGDRIYVIKSTLKWRTCWCVMPGSNVAFSLYRTDFEVG